MYQNNTSKIKKVIDSKKIVYFNIIIFINRIQILQCNFYKMVIKTIIISMIILPFATIRTHLTERFAHYSSISIISSNLNS